MSKNYLYKLYIDFGKAIRFGDLPHLIAQAMHPDTEQDINFEYGATRLTLESELESAVRNREIIVRNPLTLGASSMLVGQALKSSVVFAEDIREFAGRRLIELLDARDNGGLDTSPKKIKGRQQLQEEAIIDSLITKGFDPKNLPPRPNGGSGAKAVAREHCLQNRSLFTVKTFNSAWDRLREQKEIIGGN